MASLDFGNLKSDAGLAKLEQHLTLKSYISGCSRTQDDCVMLSKMLGCPLASKYPNCCRWYKHISHFQPHVQASWPLGTIKDALKSTSEAKPKSKTDDDDFDLFGDDGGNAAELKNLKEKCAKETEGKKKKEVINKSSLVIEIKPADADTDLDQVAKLCKEIAIEGVTWGEAIKKVPVAFGLYKLQLSCTILDDVVNTNDITDQIEGLGMTEEQKEALRKRQDGDDEDEDEDDEETCGLVQSAEIVSFNKL